MTIAISEADYGRLWEENAQNKFLDPLDRSDTTDFCPKKFGNGYERWIELPGISLLIVDQQFHKDIVIESPSGESESFVEFGFNILGGWDTMSGGTNFLDWIVDGTYEESAFKLKEGKRILKIDIHLEPRKLLSNLVSDELDLFPLGLRQVIEGTNSDFYHDMNVITPSMKLALNQILHCPFQGISKRFYLESKCLELIALKLEQLTQNNREPEKAIALKSEDVERIHQAKKILIDNFDNPPSLPELARLVGLNDRKLKQGFRQVFNTTAFGYLHDYRMVEAMSLISTGHMNINEVIRAVGYASRSSFCKAFRKRFGASPNNYRIKA